MVKLDISVIRFFDHFTFGFDHVLVEFFAVFCVCTEHSQVVHDIADYMNNMFTGVN